MRTAYRLAICALLPLVASALPARDVELVPRIGGRFGGEMADEATNRPVSLDSGVAFGLAMDVALAGDGRYLRLAWSRQRTEADLPDPALPPRRLRLDSLHFGGVYRWTHRAAQPYVTAGVGLTVIGAEDSEVFPSGSIGAGVRWPAGAPVALWIEGRGIAVFETGRASLVCGPGCALGLSGSGLFQTEVMAGLSIRL
ncbi:MAG: hypothetical protein ACRD2Z_01430 [Thermoanaerobaculia bacterium]